MGELAIRRNRSFAVSRYQGTGRAEKQSGSTQSQKAARSTVTISETLQRLMSRVSQAESHIRESRRTLQAGEGALAEVQDHLGHMAELAQKSAGGGSPDRAALQSELEQLRDDIDRIVRSASSGGVQLFLDEEVEAGDGTDALLYAVMGEALAKQDAALPDWLIKGMTQSAPDQARLLAALGLREDASPSEILAAIALNPPERNDAAGYLASLYLGAIIAGSGALDSIDPEQALEGLQQLLDTVADGVSLDEAIKMLTDGTFTSMADFQEQFTGGSAPRLQDFLIDLLLTATPSALPTGTPLLTLLAGVGGVNLDLLMDLLSATTMPNLEAAAKSGTSAPPPAAQQFGAVQVTGQDLSGVSFDDATGELIVSGAADVLIQGTGQGEQAIRLTGSGSVTLQDVNGSTLTIASETAKVVLSGRSELGEVVLEKGVSLTLEGGGLVKIGVLRGDVSNTLRLANGAAVVLSEEKNEASEPLKVPVLLDGPASLAARASSVTSANGKSLDAFDIVWKTLLPNWSGITSMEIDGHQTKLSLLAGDPARLWLSKGEHGFPQHTLVIRGRDESGRPRTRYAYLHWNQQTGAFQEVTVYPNPFAVVGGEPGQDWIYEESSHTLRILSSQVTGISGGIGTDGNQIPFSGRIVLEDYIGALTLTLGGVVCRVTSGSAFRLGRGNDVTLILQSGTDNLFEGGTGFAGISLEEATSLRIDRESFADEDIDDDDMPAGTLSATGTAGGAGIGRDQGGSRDQDSHIVICGGVITATGMGGGAGIGAGKHAAMGSITITGGTIISTGGAGGGAGIGGALGACVGDINIQGGVVTAEAVYHAAAIGAGVQGACGDILITGRTLIVKAIGGNPGADIGACLFGSCGNVQVDETADIGGASLWTQPGIPLQMGEETVTLPQFRLSSGTLGLAEISVSTQEEAQTAKVTIDVGHRLVSRIQAAYRTLYARLEQSRAGLQNMYQYINVREGPVRDSAVANSLLEEVKRSIVLQSAQEIHGNPGTEDVQQLFQ